MVFHRLLRRLFGQRPEQSLDEFVSSWLKHGRRLDVGVARARVCVGVSLLSTDECRLVGIWKRTNVVESSLSELDIRENLPIIADF